MGSQKLHQKIMLHEKLQVSNSSKTIRNMLKKRALLWRHVHYISWDYPHNKMESLPSKNPFIPKHTVVNSYVTSITKMLS